MKSFYTSLKFFVTSFFRNFFQVFSSKNLFWHILAILLTFGVVYSGFDWQYFLFMRSNLLDIIFSPAVVIGFFLPMILPLWLIFSGRRKRNIIRELYGWALTQAASLGWFVSVLYKSVTGRVQPDLMNLVVGSSRNWNFGFWEHGIFWGWPSSHTTVAFALTTAFIVLLGKKKSGLKWVSIFYAFYVGIAVSFTVHWFSEFVAGAIIGTAIGVVVGKYWKQKILKQ